jgi:hypothetical protein
MCVICPSLITAILSLSVTCLKAFFKTHGRARLHAVFVPFNMVCVKTDEGTWLKDVMARAIQAERHWQVR